MRLNKTPYAQHPPQAILRLRLIPPDRAAKHVAVHLAKVHGRGSAPSIASRLFC